MNAADAIKLVEEAEKAEKNARDKALNEQMEKDEARKKAAPEMAKRWHENVMRLIEAAAKEKKRICTVKLSQGLEVPGVKEELECLTTLLNKDNFTVSKVQYSDISWHDGDMGHVDLSYYYVDVSW